MIPGWSPIKVVETVPVGCISRSQGQKIGFQNAIFKNLLVWNYKAQSFHISYIASSRGPLPKLFKLCPWGQIWPCPGGHNFTLNYTLLTKSFVVLISDLLCWKNRKFQECKETFGPQCIRKSSNDIFSWTANGNLTKLYRNDPRVVPYQNW